MNRVWAALKRRLGLVPHPVEPDPDPALRARQRLTPWLSQRTEAVERKAERYRASQFDLELLRRGDDPNEP